MIRPKILLAADIAIRDAVSNLMTIVNINEELRPRGYPMLIPRFNVFALLERDMADNPIAIGNLEIRLGDEVIFERRVDLNFQTSRYTRLNLKIQGFIVNAPGLLKLRLTVGAETLESYSIEAFAAQGPEVVVEAQDAAPPVQEA